MKKSIFAGVMIALVTSTLWFLSGCGNPTGGGGEGGGGGDASNTGTISGTVYDYYEKTKTFVITTDVIVSVCTSDGVNIKSVAVTSLGGFTISDLPAGKIMVTFTQESSAIPITLVADSNTFKTYLNYIGADSITGSATISGCFINPPCTPNAISLNIKPLSGKDYGDMPQTVDMTNLTYEVSNAPDDGTVYIRAYFQQSSPSFAQYFAYEKINASISSINTCDITFGGYKTIEATIVPPSGYYTDRLRSYICNGNTVLVRLATCLSSEASGNLFKLDYLPSLKAGDSYYLELSAKDGLGEILSRYYYGRSAGPQTIDLSLLSYPTDVIVFPVSGEVVTGTPTFEWNAVPEVTYYVVIVKNGSDILWEGITKDTSITMPKIISDSMAPGTYSVTINAGMNVTNNPINDLTAAINWVSSGYLGSRTISFVKL